MDKDAVLVEIPTAPEVVVELADIIEHARTIAVVDQGDSLLELSPQDQAIVFREALQEIDRRQETLRACEAWVVAYLSRTGVWMAHPHQYGTLREYLTGSDMDKSTTSVLARLGEKIIPYCDDRDIPVDHLLTQEHWGKLKEGMSAATKAIRQDDPRALQSLLDDVEKAPNRDTIRDKYQAHSRVLGKGSSLRVKDKVIYVLILGTKQEDPDEAADIVARRLGKLIDWGGTIITEGTDGMMHIIDAATGEIYES